MKNHYQHTRKKIINHITSNTRFIPDFSVIDALHYLVGKQRTFIPENQNIGKGSISHKTTKTIRLSLNTPVKSPKGLHHTHLFMDEAIHIKPKP